MQTYKMKSNPAKKIAPPENHKGIILILLMLVTFVVAIAIVGLLETKYQRDLKDFLKHFKFVREPNQNLTEIPRMIRDTSNTTTVAPSKRDYYEEQQAVVVNVESSPPFEQQQMDIMEKSNVEADNSYERDPYYRDLDYFNSDAVYPQEEMSDDRDYESEATHEIPSYETVSKEMIEGRQLHDDRYDLHYAQWRFSTPSPKLDAGSVVAGNLNNRRLSYSTREPYMAYDDNLAHYNYNPHQKETHTQYLEQQKGEHREPAEKENKNQKNEEPTILTVFRNLKQVWDIYQALASAWNSIQEHHQKQAIQLQQKLQLEHIKQQQQLNKNNKKTRINSKKPPHIEGTTAGKNVKRNQTKIIKTTTAIPSTSLSSEESVEIKLEPPRGVKVDNGKKKENQTLRGRRDSNAATDVGVGRYIKGDPLKGYYDFVITEGSYKFWAVFQVGTAILIIYSTFAAIYYSKVNPLVGDYDYTDYLGGGRSMSGGDLDFVDNEDSASQSASDSDWYNWIPRTKHSLQFILDAIDKLPVDHEQIISVETKDSETSLSATTSK